MNEVAPETETKTEAETKPSPEPRFLKRAIGTFLVCLLLGPPIGSLPMAAYFAWADSENFSLMALGQVILAVSMFGYIIGGIPAIVGSLGAAWIVWRRGTLTYRQAIILGLAAGCGTGLVFDVLGSARSGQPGSAIGNMLFLSVFSLIGALGCRWLLPRLGIVDACR